jgi:DNA-binding NarL/FixJ family response regulator
MTATKIYSSALRIMLVDDHPIVRRGVRDILKDAFAASLIEEVRLGGDALALLHARSGWDVVILDLSLPDGSGMEVLERIHHLYAELPVLILSMHSADQFGRRALNAGAAGYLTKDAADTELVVAVSDIVRGRTYFRPHEDPFGDAHTTHACLSPREFQVLVAIAEGKTIGDIARDLLLGSKTVSTYRTRLLKKMNLRTNADITKYVMQQRLMH